MKKFFLFLVALVTANGLLAQNEIVVDPNATTRPVTGEFKTIKISGGIDLFISQSADVAIAVSASEEKYRDKIRTTIENGILKIYYDGDKSWKPKDKKLKAYVSFKELEKLDASGACDIKVSGAITVTSLDLYLSGACDFKGIVAVNSLKLDLSGASDVKISGTANTVDIESSGASDVKGYELVTDMCSAKASGASDIYITVNKELNAHASGASSIYFKGAGLIKDFHASGSSNVSRKS